MSIQIGKEFIPAELKELIGKEGDRKEFTYNGHHCIINRHPRYGALCGYFSVPKEDPAYGKKLTDWGQDANDENAIIDIDSPAYGWTIITKDYAHEINYAGFMESEIGYIFVLGFSNDYNKDIQPYRNDNRPGASYRTIQEVEEGIKIFIDQYFKSEYQIKEV